MTIKKIFTGILLLLALMWLGGELLLKSDERNAKMETASSEVASSEVAGARATTTLPTSFQVKRKTPPTPVSVAEGVASSILPSAPVAQSVVATATNKEMIAVALAVDGKTFTHQIEKGSSVAELIAAASASGELSYQGKEYSGLGMLITGINGKENNMAKNDLYWIYSVNGKKATKGVSQYILSSGDNVSWSYEQNTY